MTHPAGYWQFHLEYWIHYTLLLWILLVLYGDVKCVSDASN
jgi:hypothetical protein